MRLIGGIFKGRVIQAPKVQTTRPTQEALRETLFNICQTMIEESRVLDLFAGSGAIGLEALSRGATHVTFIENNREAAQCIQKNIHLLGCSDKTTLIKLDATTAIKRLEGEFDLIYIDPPYDLDTEEILKQLVESCLLKQGGSLFLEERYLPSRKQNPPSLSPLIHKKSRKVGSSLLHHYESPLSHL